MNFQQGHIYHVYNQGNNREKIFFDRENYFFFLRKIEHYLLPKADIIAWCLMPNHFHLMILVKQHQSSDDCKALNQAFAVLLRSYTRAINKSKKRSGSLFRQKTKAKCLTCIDGPTSNFFGSKINLIQPEKQYPQICFDYIHNNPVKAGLVKDQTDWEFSSALDYANLRKGQLVNKTLAKEFVEF